MNLKSKLNIKQILKFVFLVLGAAFLYFLIQKVGWDLLLFELGRMGWGFGIYLLIHAVDEAIKTAAWQMSFPHNAKVNWWKLYGILWIGSTVHHTYQTGDFGTITTKIVMVRKEVSTEQTITSLLIYTLSDALGMLLFVSMGILFMLEEINAPDSFKIALVISFSLLSISIILFWVVQRFGWFKALAVLVRKIPLPGFIKTVIVEKTVSLNDSVRSYHSEKTGYFWCAVGLNVLRRFFSTTKIHLVLSILGAPGGFWMCFYIMIFSSLIDAFFFFIPGRLGAQEGGKVFIAKTLGLTTAQGLTLGIVSRITDIIWAIMGLGLLLVWKDRSLHLKHIEE